MCCCCMWWIDLVFTVWSLDRTVTTLLVCSYQHQHPNQPASKPASQPGPHMLSDCLTALCQSQSSSIINSLQHTNCLLASNLLVSSQYPVRASYSSKIIIHLSSSLHSLGRRLILGNLTEFYQDNRHRGFYWQFFIKKWHKPYKYKCSINLWKS